MSHPMPKTTAAVALYSKGESSNGQTQLNFSADYDDELNKEWAKYTPALSVSMTVIDPVAERFLQGKQYLLTFEEQ
jgi:hypothetical protein